MAPRKKPRVRRKSARQSVRGLRCYISYSPKDSATYAGALSKKLRERGVVVLGFDDSLRLGENFVTRIREEIEIAHVVIVLATPSLFRSDWALQEIAFTAQRTRVRIFPIFFDKITDLGIAPEFLRNTTWYGETENAFRRGPSATILRYLFQEFERGVQSRPSLAPAPRTREKERPLNEGKLILVGRGEVGKTSLVRRLADDEFRGDESKTQGIKITNWPLACGGDTLRLNVWDFGGQEIMHATHQFFLTEQSLYILVLNGREGGEDIDAEYWLKHIESFGGESPVIIVLNKIAQHPFDLNYRGLQARHPQIVGFVKTDCKEDIGLADLQEMIRHTVAEMPQMRMPFPLSWFSVKERIESMRDDFIGYEGFREICDKVGVADESERDNLSWVLHCLGIALNFRADSRLRETSVLKPEWVTQGIYRLLNARELVDRQGELHVDDLRRLLPKDRYPVFKHHFLLELMRKFSLCFPFADEADRYLVPELLGKEEPPEAGRFSPSDCLNFEYEYGILPEGLIPRFIVRSHSLSRGQKRWRSGVILAHEDSTALITTEPGNRKVVIRVKGGDSGGRRRLLAIIRYDIDRINAEFKDRLEAQAKIPLTDFPEVSVDYRKLVAFEKDGVKEFPEFIGSRVVTIKVGSLLNGVDLELQREVKLEMISSADSIFLSYSHKDEVLRDELETHLKLLQRQGIISIWHDRKIPAGKDWDQEIDLHLEKAKIILLLISADFIASEYCWGKEVTIALERHRTKSATAIPIILRPCDWKSAPFGKLQGLPKGVKPITTWADRDSAWTDVAAGIRAIAGK